MVHYRRDLFRILEAALIGLFFVQAIRFLFATLFAHFSSASLVALTASPTLLSGEPGVIAPADVQTELIVVGVCLLLPLLYVIMARLWFGPALVAIVVAAGRTFMTANGGTTLGVFGAAIAAGAALLYLTCIAIRRPSMFAPLLIFGFAGDHLIRLFGATVDVSWSSEFLVEQTVVSLALFLIAVLSAVAERLSPSDDARGAISGWSALALGGMLFLEFTFFGLSNTLGHRVGVDYFTIAPFLMVASTLPLVPAVRSFARDFLNIFDAQYRGWIWFLLICLLVVIGVRIGGLPGASALIVAQFMIGLSWWWLGQPATGRFNLTGISVLLGSVVFLLLAGAEFFTYEYAFVRNVDETLGSLLRAFRGGGIPLILFALLLMALPIILTRRRPPWKGAPLTVTMAALALVIAASALAYLYAQPVPLVVQSDSNKIRIGSLNLHGGYSLYYGSNLNAIAASIRESGADIVLLQEIEAGRLVSASVDQAAWLGQALTMQVYYFPTNEALQGLAVLSRLPAEQTAGALLTSRSKQTGVQFVRVRTPAGGMLDIYNTQLSLIFRSETLAVEAQQQDQDTQMLQIFEYIEQNGSTSRKLLLGGTFNHTPADKIYTVLGQRNYIDPFAGLSAERSKTLRLVSQPPVRVDYVWLYCPQQGAPNCLQPVGVSIVPQLFSSHNLALVELQLAPASP